MSETKGRTKIPWCSDKEWCQVGCSIKRIHSLYRDKLGPVIEMAGKIRQNYEHLSVPIEELCSHTCVTCGDICCIRATIWFDLKDLLYLYFGLNVFPDAQIVKRNQGDQKTGCCHFSKKGCTLERTERPFVCTWYFCPEQGDYLNRYYPEKRQAIDRRLIEIKTLRNEMEAAFIRISCGAEQQKSRH